MHNRRARPTLRLLREDLDAGWDSPYPRRALDEGRYESLHPLSELPHPLIRKAADTCGERPSEDNPAGTIASSTALRLLEIKVGQWRGGVWEDHRGVRWLLVAGLAKGEHQDRDDFYRAVLRKDEAGSTDEWLPTPDDVRLLKQETASRLLTEWELQVQSLVLEALRAVHLGGATRFTVPHPLQGVSVIATVDLTIAQVREGDYHADEILLEVMPSTDAYKSSDLLWNLTTRMIISLYPPEQGWDRFGDTYSTIVEPGTWTARVGELEGLVDTHELAQSVPGTESHYTHREHLAGRTIAGNAVRGLCGVFFVPTQDHERLPVCPTCRQRLDGLPGTMRAL